MGEVFALGGEEEDLGVVAQGDVVAAVMHTKIYKGVENWNRDQKMTALRR
jgi:hypothetical protein